MRTPSLSVWLRLAVIVVGAVPCAAACVEHEPRTERLGGTLPTYAPCRPSSCANLPDNPTAWCDAFAVIERKCQRCHADPPQNDAPFPLMTFEHTQGCYGDRLIAERMYNAVDTGLMPYVEAELDPPVEDLTPDEKTLLLAWLREGGCSTGGPSCQNDAQ